MSSQVDINTIQNQLNYLSETKSILKTTLQSKGVNVTDDTPLRDYATELENLPSIKLYDTVEELENDTSVTNNLLGIVYKNGAEKVSFTEEFEGPIVLPKVIELDITIAELRNIIGNTEHTYVGNMRYGDFGNYEIVDEAGTVVVSGYFSSAVYASGASAGKISYYRFGITKSDVGQIWFNGDPYGNIYTRNDDIEGYRTIAGEKGKKYRFNVIKDYYNHDTNPRVADMFRRGEVNFDGMFRYNSEESKWNIAPTDLNTTSKDVWDKKYFGADGVKTGTLNSPTYITDETVTDVNDLYTKYMALFQHIDTTNITNFYNFYSKYVNNAQFLPFVKVSDVVTNCSRMFNNAPRLLSVNLNGWNTINVIDMSQMFNGATNLKFGDMNSRSWNTSNVINMSYAFSNTPVVPQLTNTINVQDCSAMFYRNPSVSSVSIPHITNITNMSKMYENCTNLNQVSTYAWRTNNVTDTSFMFSNCYNAKINSSAISGNFNSSNITNCAYMFYECRNLGYLNIPSGWMSNSTNHAYMFYNCTAMSSFDRQYQLSLGNSTNTAYMFYNSGFYWNCPISFQYSGKCVNMSHMFDGCKLNTISWGSWNGYSATDISYMFANTPKLKNLYSFQWDMPNLTSISGLIQGSAINVLNIFRGNFGSLKSTQGIIFRANSLLRFEMADTNFGALTSFNASGAPLATTVRFANVTMPVVDQFVIHNMASLTSVTGLNTVDLNSVTNFSHGFWNNPLLQTLSFNVNYKGENVTNAYLMFGNCVSLQTVPINGWNCINLVNMSGIFNKCHSLTNIDLNGWVCSNVTNMAEAFIACNGATDINLSNLNTSKVKNFARMFSGCYSLVNLDVNLDISNATNMEGTFHNCNNLKYINTTSWNFSKCTTVYTLFYNCTNLTDINMSNWNFSSITTMGAMFSGCYNIQNWDVSGWILPSNFSGAGVFERCSFNSLHQLASWNMMGWNTMNYMFTNYAMQGDQSLTNLELPNCKTAWHTFGNCYNLETLDLSNWNVPLLNSTVDMFLNCRNLKTLNLSNWIATNMTNLWELCYNCPNLIDVDFTGWNEGQFVGLARMFGQCNNLSNATIDKVINMALMSGSIPTSYRNLMPNNAYSPFYASNITNERYTARHTELTDAGWAY